MKKKINIIGYSGHAYVCIEIALLNGIIIDGYCDLNKKNENPYELNYLGEEQNMNSEREVFICIADNIIRKNIYKELDSLVLENSPIIPLYYDKVMRFSQKNIEGLTTNPVNQLNLKKVYKK